MRFRGRTRAVGVGLILTMSLAGCGTFTATPLPNLTSRSPSGAASPRPSTDAAPAPLLSRPTADVTRLDGADPAGISLSASRALFTRSPTAVVVSSADLLPAGASAAVALGVPVLLGDGDRSALQAELDRLQVGTVLQFGPLSAALRVGRVIPALPTATDLAAAVGVTFRPQTVPESSQLATAVAELSADTPALLTLTGSALLDAPSPAPPVAGDVLPAMRRATPIGEVIVLAVDDPAQVAGIATARAAGARVVLLPADRPNPQGSAAAITALSAAPRAPVLALGTPLAASPALEWTVRSARTGWQLPGGGQLLFPARTMVALYGAPGAPVLGVLGEQDIAGSIGRVRALAAQYQPLTRTTIVPTFEIIASVASSSAGPDGNYSNEAPVDALSEWVRAAGDAGVYVILDLQPGRTDFVTAARRYEALLSLPWVGLALDPEWRLGPEERHIVDIGSVGADEVNSVVDYLAGLTRANNLPPKLLVLHQFRSDMILDRQRINVSADEVTVLFNADGQGSQPAKQATWGTLRAGAPPAAWGWKNFYDEDKPMLTPEQTMQQVSPQPQLISYQ